MKSKFILTTLELVVSLTVTVHGLRCYTCKKEHAWRMHVGCLDPIGQNITSLVCEDGPPGPTGLYVCVKIQMIYRDVKWVTRGCSDITLFAAHCNLFKLQTAGMLDMACDACDTDLCNSSNRFVFYGVASMTISFIITKMLG